MSKVIMFSTSKGGQGKSTSTMLCATAFADAPFNKRVAVVDVDSQKSLVRKYEYDKKVYEDAAQLFTILNYSVEDLESNIQQLKDEYDLIFIDAAGKHDVNQNLADQEIYKLLIYTDYLFVPFCGGNFNIESTLDFLKMAINVKAIKDETDVPLTIYGYAAMYEPRRTKDKELNKETKEITDLTGVKFMDVPLKRLTIYQDADTMCSLYDTGAYEPNYINFLRWINELNNLIQI